MDAKFFDSLFEGDSSLGVKLGMGVTGGDFWCRPNGCRTVYQAEDINSISYDKATVIIDTRCSEFGIFHEFGDQNLPKQLYVVIRAVNICGSEESTDQYSVLVRFDFEGNILSEVLNGIMFKGFRQVDMGQFELSWLYSPIDMCGECMRFNVYAEDASGQINYQVPKVVVPYQGQGGYKCIVDSARVDGGVYCVKTQLKDGTESDGVLLRCNIHNDLNYSQLRPSVKAI